MTRLEREDEQLTEALSLILLGQKLQFDIMNSQTAEIIIPARRKITKTLLRKVAQANHDGLRLGCVSL